MKDHMHSAHLLWIEQEKGECMCDCYRDGARKMRSMRMANLVNAGVHLEGSCCSRNSYRTIIAVDIGDANSFCVRHIMVIGQGGISAKILI